MVSVVRDSEAEYDEAAALYEEDAAEYDEAAALDETNAGGEQLPKFDWHPVPQYSEARIGGAKTYYCEQHPPNGHTRLPPAGPQSGGVGMLILEDKGVAEDEQMPKLDWQPEPQWVQRPPAQTTFPLLWPQVKAGEAAADVEVATVNDDAIAEYDADATEYDDEAAARQLVIANALVGG
ncbi:MAG: hypothetical protein M1827_004009 [Pycnora praestabilis]|nr:MAG: hypothetical protein M1827_004009 [Pycnora praestabilis]